MLGKICERDIQTPSWPSRVHKLYHSKARRTNKTSGQSNLTKGRIAAAHAWYVLYFTVGRPPLSKLPLPEGDDGSLGLRESTIQTASRSVQLFLHRALQNVVGHAQACPFP